MDRRRRDKGSQEIGNCLFDLEKNVSLYIQCPHMNRHRNCVQEIGKWVKEGKIVEGSNGNGDEGGECECWRERSLHV